MPNNPQCDGALFYFLYELMNYDINLEQTGRAVVKSARLDSNQYGRSPLVHSAIAWVIAQGNRQRWLEKELRSQCVEILEL
ncbi:MAG: hypothetical protein WBA57_11550 [Elainellaceae cyanobacterium]